MTSEELRRDCRRAAEEFYLTHSIEQLIDHIAELMARNAEILQSLDLANQRVETVMTDEKDQLLALLVMDLGYTALPRYGHAPLRHQVAWMLATRNVADAEVQANINRMVDQERYESSLPP